MDGMHDMGGRQGFGAVRYTRNAQAFHADGKCAQIRFMPSQCDAASSTWTNTVTRSSEWSRDIT